MLLHNENPCTVKSSPVTATADVASLVARVNGTGIATGTVVEDSNEPAVTIVYQNHRTGEHVSKRPRRAVGPQIVDDECLAVKRAKGAAFIKKAMGITAAEAVKFTSSNLHYLRIWKTLEQAGDVQLMGNVEAGHVAPLAAEKMVKHLAALRTAFAAASKAELLAFFRTAAVKNFITAAVVLSAEEHLKAAIDAFGVDGTLDRLATVDGTAPASATWTEAAE